MQFIFTLWDKFPPAFPPPPASGLSSETTPIALDTSTAVVLSRGHRGAKELRTCSPAATASLNCIQGSSAHATPDPRSEFPVVDLAILGLVEIDACEFSKNVHFPTLQPHEGIAVPKEETFERARRFTPMAMARMDGCPRTASGLMLNGTCQKPQPPLVPRSCTERSRKPKGVESSL